MRAEDAVRVVTPPAELIVRWGLAELSGLLDELGMKRPFVVTGKRWSHLDLPGAARWTEVPTDRIGDIAQAALGSDGILVVGGGSAIDLAKAVSSATSLRVACVPTTYSGAEFTPSFAIRNQARRFSGAGSGAHVAGIVYEPALTLDLPRAESGGTAMNALSHCAEALYVAGRNETGHEHALEGARLIGKSLPRVLADGHDRDARQTLLEGAMHGGVALAAAGLGLAHAMAQAVGIRYGIPHGAANALCLPPALRFNQSAAEAEIARFGEALGTTDPATRCQEFSRLSGYERLRNCGVSDEGLSEIAEVTASRPGALANPKPASPAQILDLLRSIW
jgi:maleylacetate reductase